MYSLFILLGMAGCEFGTHPLIIDGSVATAQFPVNADIPSFLPAAFTVEDSLDLGGIYDAVDEVDSIKFYNLTFIAQGDSAGLAIRLTGAITVDGAPFLNFNDVPLSVFSPERSIFNPVAGFSYDPAGVNLIRQALAPGSTDNTLRMSGSFQANSRSLHFTLQAKLYTQVFLRSIN
ncbi:MAG TPA: hypothetical protein VI932_12675 [Bacteroidota bacterium]|nr:hypothetical protein [Bacteroidota bacterium]